MPAKFEEKRFCMRWSLEITTFWAVRGREGGGPPDGFGKLLFTQVLLWTKYTSRVANIVWQIIRDPGTEDLRVQLLDLMQLLESGLGSCLPHQ